MRVCPNSNELWYIEQMKPAHMILCLLLVGCSPGVTLDEFQYKHIPPKPAENCNFLHACHDSLPFDVITGWADFPDGFIPDSIQFYPTREDLEQKDPSRCITLEPLALNYETDFFNVKDQAIEIYGLLGSVEDIKEHRPDLIQCETPYSFRGLVNIN